MAYPWRPSFGQELDVLYVEQRARDQVYFCRQEEASTIALPSWMFQPAICSQMKLGQARVSLAALDVLRGILSEIAFHQQQVAAAPPLKRYACRRGHSMQGLEPCVSFGAVRPDLAVGKELLLAVGPLAVEAAIMAEGDARQKRHEKRRAVELELEQARYEAQLASRYHAFRPEK